MEAAPERSGGVTQEAGSLQQAWIPLTYSVQRDWFKGGLESVMLTIKLQ
jgi:hypothetical protein